MCTVQQVPVQQYKKELFNGNPIIFLKAQK